MPLRLRAGSATDVGRVRPVNQDDLLVTEALCAVADGMGGHAAGEVASGEAISALREAFEGEQTVDGLVQAVRWANRAVWRRGNDEPAHRGMGTTLTAVAVVRDGDGGAEQLAVANVGDSRSYLFRDGELTQLTEDHSVVQEAVRLGQLSSEEAERHPHRSRLTRALGIDADIRVDVQTVDPLTGDRILLCSDGLWDELSADDIAAVLAAEGDTDAAADELVRRAKDAGGRDNITVVVVDVVEADDRERALAASAALAEDDGGPPTIVLPTGRRRGTSDTADTEARDGDDEEKGSSGGSASGAAAGSGGILGAHADGEPTPSGRRERLFTWRSVAFAVALVAIVAVAIVAFRAGESAYRVVAVGQQLVIQKDGERVGEPSALDVRALPEEQRRELERGRAFPTRREAEAYLRSVELEAIRQGHVTVPGAGLVRDTTTTGPPADQPPPPSTGDPAGGPPATTPIGP